MALRENMSNEKVYRFVSDPGHKENLSGRVRAACLNCRRKKTKCSGEVPCNTCEEKGVVCEGLTERKRPTKNGDRRSRASSSRRSSLDLGSEDGNVPSKRNSFDSSSTRTDGNDGPVQRPTVYLRKKGTFDSEDSGYASGTQSRQENTSTPALQLETQFPFSYSYEQATSSNYNDSPAISLSRNRYQDWNLASQLELTGLSATENAESEFSPSPMATTAAVSTTSVDWLNARDRSKFWIEDSASAQAATKLLTAAQALEQQAMTLRRLADQEPADETRRQTVNFPIYDQYAAPMGSSTQLLPGSYDDLSLMLSERASRTGLTPLATNFNSWWDIHPELSSSYGFHPHTTTGQQPGPVPCIPRVPSAETLWPRVPTPYNSASSAAGPRKPAKLSEQGADARQAAQRYRGQSQNAYEQLYPWPE